MVFARRLSQVSTRINYLHCRIDVSAIDYHPIIQGALCNEILQQQRSFVNTSTFRPCDVLIFNPSTTTSTTSRPCCRNFSSRLAKNDDDNKKDVLMNDRLVVYLMQQKGVSSSAGLDVRVISDPPSIGEKSITEVITLTDAIQKSLNRNLDLVAIDTTQEIPVLRITNVQSFLYQQTKKLSESKKKTKSLPAKEIRFQTGIADNDLRRKAEQVIQYLEKGHNCLVSVRATRRNARGTPDGADKTVQSILQLIANDSELMNPPKSNPDRTLVQFQVRPLSKKK